MPLGGTIIARATGAGFAPLAIVRLSGPETRVALCALLGEVPPERRAVGAVLRLPRLNSSVVPVEVLPLPVGVLLFGGPRSYTGEDSAEITLPGNPHLIGRVIDAALTVPGVRRAEPGEFTARALLNDKLTLDQAEGVAQLIAASSESQRRAGAELMSGATGEIYRGWADELTTLLALVEAGIDFTDQEDVVAIEPGVLARRLGVLQNALRERTSGETGRESREGLPTAALAGAPSAGKSTLFNALLGRRRAMTSAVPGTTRDVLREELDLSSAGPWMGRVELLDLAGLDLAAGDPLAQEAQRAARAALEACDVIVWCDPSGRFDEAGLGLQARGRPVIRVRTKADLALEVGETSAIGVCALDGSNLGSLVSLIAQAATSGGEGDAVLPRHRAHMVAGSEAIGRAIELAPSGEAELIAGELRAALDEIGELVGRISADDVIGRIFSTFCVGK